MRGMLRQESNLLELLARERAEELAREDVRTQEGTSPAEEFLAKAALVANPPDVARRRR